MASGLALRLLLAGPGLRIRCAGDLNDASTVSVGWITSHTDTAESGPAQDPGAMVGSRRRQIVPLRCVRCSDDRWTSRCQPGAQAVA